jgi:predicted dehydrogenase
MKKKDLNIGLVGYGFMGRAHSNAFLQAGRFFDLPARPVLKAVCARNRERLKTFAENWGYESVETDWRKLVERKDIDLIDIASPQRYPRRNRHRRCPRGQNDPVRETAGPQRGGGARDDRCGGIVPGSEYGLVQLSPCSGRDVDQTSARQNRFGRIFHYRAKFLQDWTISADLPQGGEGLWRLDRAIAGSGVTGDLLAHAIDTALWLNGPIAEVTAMTETFIKERKHNLTGQVQPVGIDDASAFLARFENGSLATFEATRYARGHKALYTLEINGEHASAQWDLHDLHRIQYYDHRDEGQLRGWRNIHVTDGDHPYMQHWWVPGLQIGYEHTFVHQFADFLSGTSTPTFREALATDIVTDAVLESAANHEWRKVEMW